MSADATIDIITISEIYTKLGINPADVGKVQIITTCDGFSVKSKQEIYIRDNLDQEVIATGKHPFGFFEKNKPSDVKKLGVLEGDIIDVSHLDLSDGNKLM